MGMNLSGSVAMQFSVSVMPRSRTRQKKVVGKRNFVAMRRRALKMTQEDLAAAADVDQATISLLENQNVWPTYENLAAIAVALGCETFEQLWSDPSHEDLNHIAANLDSKDRATVVEMVRAFVRTR